MYTKWNVGLRNHWINYYVYTLYADKRKQTVNYLMKHKYSTGSIHRGTFPVQCDACTCVQCCVYQLYHLCIN